jgi:hypothetical protein
MSTYYEYPETSILINGQGGYDITFYDGTVEDMPEIKMVIPAHSYYIEECVRNIIEYAKTYGKEQSLLT